MKKQLLYTAAAFLVAHFATAQVLYTENFDNLTVGNIGTDPTGATTGQGGWYTRCHAPSAHINNNYFKIVAEPGRGNVMEITSPTTDKGASAMSIAEKKNLETLWSNRSTGNDVLKIEYDFFTGDSLTNTNNNDHYIIGTNDDPIIQIVYKSATSEIGVGNITNTGVKGLLYNTPIPRNTWLRLIMYLDYGNKKAYFRIPSLAINAEGDFSTSGSNPMTDLTPSVMLFRSNSSYIHPQCVFKYDSITISAVDTVPLSTQDFISSKFKLYPNPVNNEVTITNNENIIIEEITVYDMNGKRVKSQKNKTDDEIQLNLSNLSSATYLLHIKTSEGTAVKKLIKN